MRKSVVALSGSSVLVLLTAGCAEDNESGTYQLDLGHVQTTDEPFHEAFVDWAETVEDRTDGEVEIEIYPDSALGEEEDILEQMTLGSNVAWQTDPARLGGYVNEWNVLYAPYLLDGMDDVESLLESDEVASWVDELEDEYGLTVLSYAFVQGPRNVFSTTEANSFEELNNLQIRTAPANMWVETVNSFATAVDLPYSDIYNSLETGVIEGAELPYLPAEALNIDEVTDTVIETEHIFQLNTIAVSSDWFNDLPEEYQEILTEELDAAGLEASERALEGNEESKANLEDSGLEIVPHEDLDIDAFEEAGEEAYERMGLEEVRDRLYEELN